ncbi:MAG: tetratricopeptide repeat protein, partial [Flavobacteriales bacterium]
MKHFFQITTLFIIFSSIFLTDQLLATSLKKVDSLKRIIESSSYQDTIKLNALNQLSNNYRKLGKYEKGIKYAKKAVKLGEKLEELNKKALVNKGKSGISSAYNNIGVIYEKRAEYTNALKYHYKSLKIEKELDNKNGMAISYNNLGIIFHRQGNYSKALKYYLNAVKIDKELGNKRGLAASYNNIGIIYHKQKRFDKALKFYRKSIDIERELGRELGIANTFTNIGTIYKEREEYVRAMDELYNAYEIFKKQNNQRGIATVLNSLGSLLTSVFSTNESTKKEVKKWLLRNNEIGVKKGIKGGLMHYAKRYHKKALKIGKKTSNDNILLYAYKGFAKLYSNKGEYQNS